jgi:hypothetical protein
MQAILLGLVTVPTAGTDAALTLTAAHKVLLPPSGLANKIEVWPNPAAVGTVSVRSAGQTIAEFPANATGPLLPFEAHSEVGVNPLAFALGAVTSGDGAFVTLWVN